MKKILAFYIFLLDRWIMPQISELGMKLFNGLHPKNVFHYRSRFFRERVTNNDIVLDIGCGTGKILFDIKDSIKQGIGIDYSEHNLNLCRTQHPANNIIYEKSDFLTADFNTLKQKYHYNTVILSHVLEHIEDSIGFLQKINTQKLLLCVPSQENWLIQLKIHLGLPYLSDPTHFREYTCDMLQKEVQDAGYHIDYIGYNSEAEIICYAQKIQS